MIHISANAVKQTLYKSEVLVILNDLFATFFLVATRRLQPHDPDERGDIESGLEGRL